MQRAWIGVLAVLWCAGCAGISPAQVGQTAGTIVGSAIIPGIGAPIGALVGLLAGMVVQGEADKVNEKRERKTLSDELASDPEHAPSADGASPPQGEPTRVWGDETIKNGRFFAGHFDIRHIQ